jgi:hypothetical protein
MLPTTLPRLFFAAVDRGAGTPKSRRTHGVDRVLVQMPAWRVVGVAGWAAYSRHADLGNGLVLYSTVAIAGCALSVTAAIAIARERAVRRAATIPAYLAAALTVLGLLLTIKAAPFMLSLRRVGDDPIGLQRAFDGFDWWGNIRSVVQTLGFVANLWSLVAMGDSAAPDEHRAT